MKMRTPRVKHPTINILIIRRDVTTVGLTAQGWPEAYKAVAQLDRRGYRLAGTDIVFMAEVDGVGSPSQYSLDEAAGCAK